MAYYNQDYLKDKSKCVMMGRKKLAEIKICQMPYIGLLAYSLFLYVSNDCARFFFSAKERDVYVVTLK